MILNEITEKTKERVAEQKKRKSAENVMELAMSMPAQTGFPFKKALRSSELSFICEIKKASPSKGIINQSFDYLSIAAQYEKAGASALSVLTEPAFFLGSDEILRKVAHATALPILRKDFTIDSYQIYEAKLLGASAVLLICALLDPEKLFEFLAISKSLGLSALVEAHDETELTSSVKAGAEIIGINNRNLKTFEVDLSTSIRLRKLIPDGTLFVSESGIRTSADVSVLKEIGADAVLVGEALMKSGDIAESLKMLRSGL